MNAKWVSSWLSGATLLVAVTMAGPVAGQGVFPPAYHHEVYTPLEWQPKLLNSSRDLNQNFVDDAIDAMPPTNRVNIILDLNDCVDVSRFAAYGGITYTGRYLTVVCLTNVIVTNAIALGQDSAVAMVELSRVGQIMLDKSVPNIRVRSSLNYSPNTVQDAYPTIDGAGVNIAILDTGVDDGLHESLPASKFVGGYNAITDTEGNPVDDNGHGTHVAGIAMGTGGASGTYRGVAPGAGLVDIKVADAGGFVAIPDLLRAIDKCIEHRTDWNIGVANMSLGFCSIVDNGSDSLSQAVNRMVMAGIVAVVAMGNTPNCGLPDNTQEVIAPAAADYAISVAASDDHGQINRTLSTLAPYSLTGPRLDDGDTDPYDELKPDVTAPGTAITSAQFGTVSGYIQDSGTSMATPHVAGLAALILQSAPTMTPLAVRKLIRDTAEPRGTHPLPTPLPDAPTWDEWWGYGLVDGYAAINQLATSLKTDLRFDQNTSSPDPENWLSADLFPVDGFVQEGVANTVQANIRNNGPNPASNFQVRMGVYGFSNGDLDYDIGTITVAGPLAAGGTMTLSRSWTPSVSGFGGQPYVHACLKAQIITPFDTDYSNNGAQHNVDIYPTHSPAVFNFAVVNPTGTNISVTVSNDMPNISPWTLVVAGVTNGPVTFQMAAKECPQTLHVTLTPPPGLVGTQAVKLRIFGSVTNSPQVFPLGGVQVVAVALASNSPPHAASDSYSYLPGQTLSVAAPGVLNNDSDPDGDPINAVLVTPAQHGQVLLLADGSFNYTPLPGYSGSDAFVYQATDGKGARSLSAFVALNPLPPALTIRQNITGVINGQSFSGGAFVYYSNSPAIPTGMSLVIDLTNSPPSLVLPPIVWDCVCLGHGSTNLLDTINVFEAVGPVFHLQRDNTVFDSNFNPLGSFAVSMDFQMTSSNQALANLNVQGNYSGPTDIVQSNGTIRANSYTMALRQTGPTNIVGQFIQSIYENSGAVLLNVVTNNYTYPTGGGPGLPFDELSHVRVDNVTWNGTNSTLSVLAAGYFDSAPAVTGSLFTLAESVSGQLNGMGFGANGTMTYDRGLAPSPMTNSMGYIYYVKPIFWPPNWWPPGGWNDITYDCYGHGLLLTNDTVQGLRDVLGPVFHLERNSIVLGASNAVLSSATMHMDHQAISSNWGVTDTAMEGAWNMPYSITPAGVSETGFNMQLHQSGPNTIVGSYQKSLYVTNGMVLTNVVNDTWTYPTGGGPGLPFDEVAHIQVIQRTWDGTNAYFEGTGYYEAGRPTLAITENSNGTFTLTYTGTLYSSQAAGGPYNPVPGASSPWTVNPRTAGAPSAQFYRAGP